MPAASHTARTAEPAITPAPGVAGNFRSLHPTRCGLLAGPDAFTRHLATSTDEGSIMGNPWINAAFNTWILAIEAWGVIGLRAMRIAAGGQTADAGVSRGRGGASGGGRRIGSATLRIADG